MNRQTEKKNIRGWRKDKIRIRKVNQALDRK